MPLGHPSVVASIEYENYADAREKLGKVLSKFLGKPSELRRKFAEYYREESRRLFESK